MHDILAGSQPDGTACNEEYGRYFPADKPVRTTIEVMLNAPEPLVEITVVACIEESRWHRKI